MSATVIGSAADRALDASTKGRRGTARPGFHLAILVRRGVTASGMPSQLPAGQKRCTCSERGNHAAVVR